MAISGAEQPWQVYSSLAKSFVISVASEQNVYCRHLLRPYRVKLRPNPLMCYKYRVHSTPGKPATVVNDVARSAAANANYVRERVCTETL
jgi:hypothetical protein